VAGLDNLSAWLGVGENATLAEEGVTLSQLGTEAVSDLAGHEHGVDGLAGVSLLTPSPHGAGPLMEALTQYDWKDIAPDVYLTYERTWDEGEGCIVDRSCLWAEGSVHSVADWGLLGEVTADRRIEYRWVETGAGWSFLQRWWLTEPSTGTKLDLEIGDQYYVGVNLPAGNGTTRVHASWLTMDMSTGDASEGAANTLISNWAGDAESLDTWIDDNL